MKRLALLASTGVLALMLTACGGDNGAVKPTETTTPADAAVTQPVENTDAAKPADTNTTTTTTTTTPDGQQSTDTQSTETKSN